MGSSKSFNDHSLFSDVEQKRLHMFLDGLEEENTANNATSTMPTPTPILLSSPYQVGTAPTKYPYSNSIHINSLVIQNDTHTKKQPPVKKYQQKRMSPYSPTSSSSTTTSSSDEYNKSRKSSTKASKKQTHELLSEDQKRANHIASEQKRRANIRVGFEKLVDIVPTLSSGHRSEALILQKSVEHLRLLVESKTKLKEKARELQLMLGEIPDEDSSEGEIDYDF